MKYGFDLTQSEDGLSVIATAVDNLYLRCEKEKDTAVLGEIQRIATENGIDTYLTLNEKAIINAFKKQIPKKPVDVHYPWALCPSCGGSICLKHIQEHIQNEENTYCEHCGQALDWSDTE